MNPSRAPILLPVPDPTPTKDKPLPYAFGLPEAADWLGLSYDSLYKEVREKRLRTKRYGVIHVVKREVLEAWFDALPDNT